MQRHCVGGFEGGARKEIEWGRKKKGHGTSANVAQRGGGRPEHRGRRGTFHSLSGLISRPLGRLRLLAGLLLLLLPLYLLHVPLLGGRLKLT